jgi:LacI family transcriptional regulator
MSDMQTGRKRRRQPRRTARLEADGHPHDVAVILDPSHSYQRRIIRGIAEHVQRGAGWRLFIESRSADMVPDPRTWRGDGVIAFFGDRRTERLVAELRVPAVSIERGHDGVPTRIPVVATDNAAIGRLGAEHFLERGFRHLAYCGAADQEYWCEPRGAAFAEAAAAAGTTCSLFRRRQRVSRDWPSTLAGLAEWIASLPRPTGILAGNDARARHVVEACRMVGRRVPEDVAVLGVDNDEMLCELTTPSLSSIEHDARRIGRRAAEMLDDMMNGGRIQGTVLVPPLGVIARRSSDALAVVDPEVSAAIAFLHANVRRSVYVEDVARASGLSLSTLKSRFKLAVGRPVHAELQRLRIDEARRLLATTELPVKKVATLVGFADISHFTTAFRRHTGVPPGRYRAQVAS